MSDERDENLDERLSALHDGELGPDEARTLRRRIESDPALARRQAAFARVDEGLRGIEGRDVPADLALRLQARIAAGAQAPPRAARVVPLRTAPPRRVRRALAGWGVAAAAAGLLLYVSLQPSAPPSVAPAELAQRDPVVPTTQAPPGEPSQRALAALPVETVVEAVPPAATPADPFAGASEDELAIALQYDTLSDFDMIEDMEMLELLAALDDVAPRG